MRHPSTQPPSSSPSSEARRGEKGERILQAAMEVFAEKGFFHATVAEVARRAGVADGTIYLYYKGKDDLLIRLFEEIMARINQTLAEAVAEHEGAGDKLIAFADAQAELVSRQKHYAEVICVELRQSSKFIKEYDNPGFKTYLAFLTDIIAAGQQAGEFDDAVPAPIVARTFFGALDELHLAWSLARRSHFDLREAAVGVARLFVRGLAPGAESS